MPLPRAVAGLHAPPQQRHGISRLQRQRPAHGHRKIKARRRQFAVVGVVEIVQHVDAATKNQHLVHHAKLAVQPAPTARQQQAQTAPAQPAHAQRRIHEPLHARCSELFLPFCGQGSRTYAIDQHLYRHAAPGRTHQRVGHLCPGPVKVKNIGFQLYPPGRAIKGLDKRREKRLSALKQLQRLGLAELGQGHQGGASLGVKVWGCRESGYWTRLAGLCQCGAALAPTRPCNSLLQTTAQ